METLGSLWQYYRDGPPVTEVSVIDDFLGALFKFKQNIVVEKILI